MTIIVDCSFTTLACCFIFYYYKNNTRVCSNNYTACGVLLLYYFFNFCVVVLHQVKLGPKIPSGRYVRGPSGSTKRRTIFPFSVPQLSFLDDVQIKKDDSLDCRYQKAGFLLKLPFMGKGTGRWQKRWFVLKDGYLLYYGTFKKATDKFDQHPREQFHLEIVPSKRLMTQQLASKLLSLSKLQ